MFYLAYQHEPHPPWSLTGVVFHSTFLAVPWNLGTFATAVSLLSAFVGGTVPRYCKRNSSGQRSAMALMPYTVLPLLTFSEVLRSSTFVKNLVKHSNRFFSSSGVPYCTDKKVRGVRLVLDQFYDHRCDERYLTLRSYLSFHFKNICFCCSSDREV